MSWMRHNMTLVTHSMWSFWGWVEQSTLKCIDLCFFIIIIVIIIIFNGGNPPVTNPHHYHYCQNPTMVGFWLVGICRLATITISSTIKILTSLFGAFPVSSSAYSTFALAVAGVVAGNLWIFIFQKRFLTTNNLWTFIVSKEVSYEEVSAGLLLAYALLTDSLSTFLSSSSSRSSSSSSSSSSLFGSQSLFDTLTSIVLAAVERDEDWINKQILRGQANK